MRSVIIKDSDGRQIAEWPVREDLTVLLCEQIIEKLADSDDLFFKLAFENVDQLPGIVEFDPTEQSGGKYVNGRITIGRKSAMSTDQEYADGDVMATIFHEYMHYLSHQNEVYPYEYENELNGRVYSLNTDFGKKMEDDNKFNQRAFEYFIDKKVNEPEVREKYMDYPIYYNQLNSEQQKEVEQHIIDNNLKHDFMPDRFRYLPSNYLKDEINAHEKTREASGKGLFLMSDEKIKFYHEEELRYNKQYNLSLKVEERDGYPPTGPKKKEK